MTKRIIILIAAAVFTVLSGCEVFSPPVVPGVIDFPDYTAETKILGGKGGTMAFGEKLVGIGERAILPLAVSNTGEGDLVVTGIHTRTDKTASSDPDVFRIVDGTYPDFPLVIPPGKTVNDIFIEFDPVTAGDITGKVFIDTESGSHYLDLTGTGLWRLRLSVPAAGDDSKGTIVLPIEVKKGETKDITSSTGIFQLSCETDFLNEFVEWVVSSTFDPAADPPVFDNVEAKKTSVVINTHTEITVDILSPYVRVTLGDTSPADYFDNFTDAINYCVTNHVDGGGTKIAVIASAGTYTVGGDIVMAANVPVYGGYRANWSDRAYKTAASRATDAAHRTVINIGGSVLFSGSSLNSKVVLEGFTLTNAGGNEDGLVEFTNYTTAGLQYNTLTSGGASEAVGVFCTNSAAPLIRYNYINGGTSTANYSKSIGIKVTEKAKPVIYKNSVSGGAAQGADSQSFGIFCDFETEPLVRNNAPTASDSWGISGGSGAESYGVYMINNGNMIARYNNISGGSGTRSTALFNAYGGYFKLYNNNIYTSGGTDRYGVVTGINGRVYKLLDNGLYDCPSGLFDDFFGSPLKDIDDVNDKYHTDTNKGEAIDLSAAPAEVMYE